MKGVFIPSVCHEMLEMKLIGSNIPDFPKCVTLKPFVKVRNISISNMHVYIGHLQTVITY